MSDFLPDRNAEIAALVSALHQLADPQGFRGTVRSLLAKAAAEGRLKPAEFSAVTTESLFERVLRNVRATRPILDGVSVWRGAMDPGIEATSSGTPWKAGSVNPLRAALYCFPEAPEVGFNPLATRGYGALARYELHDKMRFGEAGVSELSTYASLGGVEHALYGLIQAAIKAGVDIDQPETFELPEAKALNEYLASTMVDVMIPVEAKAKERWLAIQAGVLGETAETGFYRIDESRRNTLHDVATALLEARRLEINTVSLREAMTRVEESIAQTPDTGVRGALQSVHLVLRERMETIHGKLATLPGSLMKASDARREEQAAMSLYHLAGEDMRIETSNLEDCAVMDIASLCGETSGVEKENATLEALKELWGKLMEISKIDANRKFAVSRMAELDVEIDTKTTKLDACATILAAEQAEADQAKVEMSVEEQRSGVFGKLKTAFGLTKKVAEPEVAGAPPPSFTAQMVAEISAARDGLLDEKRRIEATLQDAARQREQLIDGFGLLINDEASGLVADGDFEASAVKAKIDAVLAACESVEARIEEKQKIRQKLRHVASVLRSGGELSSAMGSVL